MKLPQAITISFTSSVIEKLVYAFDSDDGSISGFLDYRNFDRIHTNKANFTLIDLVLTKLKLLVFQCHRLPKVLRARYYR